MITSDHFSDKSDIYTYISFVALSFGREGQWLKQECAIAFNLFLQKDLVARVYEINSYNFKFSFFFYEPNLDTSYFKNRGVKLDNHLGKSSRCVENRAIINVGTKLELMNSQQSFAHYSALFSRFKINAVLVQTPIGLRD